MRKHLALSGVGKVQVYVSVVGFGVGFGATFVLAAIMGAFVGAYSGASYSPWLWLVVSALVGAGGGWLCLLALKRDEENQD